MTPRDERNKTEILSKDFLGVRQSQAYARPRSSLCYIIYNLHKLAGIW
jgi:hypothetical protein